MIRCSWAVNQHIRMISEGSCDTEDCSNDAENSALHQRKKKHFKWYSNRKQLFKLWEIHNIAALLYFESNKCSLKNKKISIIIYMLNINYIILHSFCFPHVYMLMFMLRSQFTQTITSAPHVSPLLIRFIRQIDCSVPLIWSFISESGLLHYCSWSPQTCIVMIFFPLYR